MLNMTLYNILKELNILIIVSLDIKLCGFEQYNDKDVLVTKSCKDCIGRVGFSFYWDVFGIESMV